MKTTFPEDLTVLSVEELTALQTAGIAEFDSLFPTGDEAARKAAFAAMSEEDVTTLRALKTGLTAVKDEFARRAERQSTLAELGADREEFARVTGTFEGETAEDADAEESGDAEKLTVGDASASVAPSYSATPTESVEEPAPVVAYAVGQDLGVPVDAPLTYAEVGKALDRRLSTFNATPYARAALEGKVLKRIDNFAKFTRDIPENRMLRLDSSRSVIREVIDAARNERNTPKGSLIASGGWGAPSNISYDRFGKLSSRDGIATFPEVGIDHGGLQIPHGSTFASVFASAEFISFTEQQDIDGEYAIDSNGDNVEGTKPIYRIPPTEWVDHRLRVDGVHIQTGILNQRGYPQGVSEEVEQVLDVHAHVINAKVIAAAVAGSTAVTMPTTQAGAAAPLLTTIELEVNHYRDTHRMRFDETLEMKIPFWIRGVIRADLSRRMGVDLIDVPDARINGWFTDRGVSVEYLYDWQSIAVTAAGSFTEYPTTVSFLLYSAGTWVKGVSPVISFDTMYDSTLIGTNDFTVLFTEEGWFLAKAGPDSRVVTVGINPTGVTHIGDEITRNGTAA